MNNAQVDVCVNGWWWSMSLFWLALARWCHGCRWHGMRFAYLALNFMTQDIEFLQFGGITGAWIGASGALALPICLEKPGTSEARIVGHRIADLFWLPFRTVGEREHCFDGKVGSADAFSATLFYVFHCTVRWKLGSEIAFGIYASVRDDAGCSGAFRANLRRLRRHCLLVGLAICVLLESLDRRRNGDVAAMCACVSVRPACGGQ